MTILSFNNTGQNSLGWRLGNQMFQYASLLGIATKNELTPYFNITDTYLGDCFKLGGVVNKIQKKGYHNLFDGNPSFNPGLFNLDNNFNFDLDGYFQTEKYFSHCETEVKKEFQFKDNIQRQAKEFLPKGQLVSLHVRRGDYLDKPDYHTNLQIAYYESAMEKFKDHSPVIFSDDIAWCRENLSHISNEVHFSDNPPEDGNIGVYVDLCMMTLCDAHIIANSSFSWWGAYLGGGTTVAPARWNGPDAPQNFQDIYLKEWILL
tara:strand:+ start:903 stop:1688 length:786 start_codon:yes stop_codon:yes gene_type:complete